MNRLFSPKLQMILAMVIFGTIPLFVKETGVSSGALAMLRAGIAVVLVGAYLLVRRQKLMISGLGKEIVLLILSGAAMGFNWIFLFEAYRYIPVSAATLTYYFAPVLVMALSYVLFHEKLTAKQIVCFAMATLGVVLITGFDGAGERHFLGILLALSAACLYASVILINKGIRRVQGLQRTFWQFVSAFLVLLPYVLLTGGGDISDIGAKELVFILIVGVVHTGGAYILYFSALSELPGKTAAILSYIDPLVAVVVSVAVLREPVSFAKVAGGALILGFTLLNEISVRRSKKFRKN